MVLLFVLAKWNRNMCAQIDVFIFSLQVSDVRAANHPKRSVVPHLTVGRRQIERKSLVFWREHLLFWTDIFDSVRNWESIKGHSLRWWNSSLVSTQRVQAIACKCIEVSASSTSVDAFDRDSVNSTYEIPFSEFNFMQYISKARSL